MSPSIETISLFREVAGRKAFKKHMFETSFKEGKDKDDLNGEKDKYIRIPKGVINIGDNAFEDCESLKEIIIPNSVTSIKNGAFRYCANLKEIVIPNSITSIGENAFSENTKVIYE